MRDRAKAQPLALCDLEFAQPESAGERHFDLGFVGATCGFVDRAAHEKFSRRAPAQRDAGNRAPAP